MSTNNTSYKIIKLDTGEPVIKLYPALISKLKIDVRKPVQLKFGSLVCSVNVTQLNAAQPPAGGEMQLSPKVMQELHIPENIKLSIRRIKKNKLRLGPVIGILTFPGTYANKYFDFYLNYHVMLESGLLFVFGSRGINSKTNTVQGYYYNPSVKTWTLADLPYPDAVIDRCYPNPYRIHTRLEKQIGKGKIFNKKTLINKLDFYTALCKDNVLRNHLPETRFCTDASDIADLLEKHGRIFIKPAAGMQGAGIVTAALEDDRIICRYMVRGRVLEKKMTKPRQVLKLLEAFGHPRRRYIIQEAVPIVGYRGKPFCFRVMVCKNGQGSWVVPAIFTNAAKGNSFLTNHAAGASRFIPLNSLFNDIENRLKTTKADLIDSLAALGARTAGLLDKKYGPLGELGLDVVINQSGKLIVLEGNGNPGMVPISHMVDFPNWVYQMFKLPVSYAVHLAGFENLHHRKN